MKHERIKLGSVLSCKQQYKYFGEYDKKDNYYFKCSDLNFWI